MGGYGSGRPGRGYPKSDQMLRLDLARLERRGYLRGGPYRMSWSWGSGGDDAGSIVLLSLATGLKLMYRSRRGDDEWQDVDELVPFIWTPTKFGGQRRWFQCLSCGRKCRVLYGGGRFRCRRCRVCATARNRRRERIAPRGPCSRSLSASIPKSNATTYRAKPKGMHWRTYNRLAERYEHYDAQWAVEAMRRFGFKL